MKRLLNKLLTHDRDEQGDFGSRVFLHIPIGLIIGIPILGANLKDLFIQYELDECAHSKDEAWKDLFGALIGASITTLIAVLLIIWMIWKWHS